MKNERLLKIIIIALLFAIIIWFGLRPLFTGTSLKNYIGIGREDLDLDVDEYSTIVIGSDPEGVASALACARTGVKTLLITADKDLGGYFKKSMIAEIHPQQTIASKGKVILNKGIYEEIFGSFKLGFTGEDYEKAAQKLAESEENLDVIYDSMVLDVKLKGERVTSILVQQTDGVHRYRARNFIDATRDGDLLMLCNTPYFKGSEDVGLKDTYAPLKFNFKISGVDTEALKKVKKTTAFVDEFQLVLLAYQRVNANTKILSPSFIILNDNELVISGLEVFGVNVENQQEITEAYASAEEEAIMLTAYLKNVLAAFKDCTYKASPESFFIPEYRHFEGRYRLAVSDILENRNFKEKIALCSEAVDAGKFADKNVDYIVTKPVVYSIPLGSIIPSNLDNVMMTGAKASFASLAATSAGSLPTRITVGEAAGLVSSFSCIHDKTPAELLDSEEELKALNKYLTRGNIELMDFSESIMIPETDQKLSDHWAYGYVKELAEWGLIAGGGKNDFKLDYKASQELLAVLLKNAIIKIVPEAYHMELDKKLENYERREMLTGETAAMIVLDILGIPSEPNKALDALLGQGVLPAQLTGRLKKEDPVTMDVIYGLAVETVNKMGR